jgi:hypothetical protein
VTLVKTKQRGFMQLNDIKNLKQNKKYYKIVAQIKSTKDKLKELEEKKKKQAFKMLDLRVMT